MIFKSGNRYISLGGKFISGGSVSLEFGASGAGFPKSYPYPEGTVNYRTGRMVIDSKTPNKATINYGDGTVITYDFGPHNTNYRIYFADINTPQLGGTRVEYHTYTDLNTTARVITISFQSPEAVTLLHTNIMDVEGIFPASVDKLTSLTEINLNYPRLINSFPTTIANSKINNLVLVQIGPALSNGIPLEFLNMPLVTFSLAGSVDLFNANTSNFSKINRLASTLLTLYVSACKIETLPVEFKELTLRSLFIDTNNFIATPPEVNAITSLEVLRIGGGYGHNNIQTEWGDFRNLTKLNYLSVLITQYISATVPAWFVSLISLKSFLIYGSYKTVERADQFVNSFYEIVSSAGFKTGVNTDPFRAMNIDFNHTSYPNAKPSGIYQQPAGFALGIDNGTPASPQEKIWVMVNQYAHSWTLPA